MKYKAQKATGVSVEAFYDQQDAAAKETSTGKQANLFRYSCLILARVEPMPTLDEFRNLLDDEITALVADCKQLNPRHFSTEAIEPDPTDQKKSVS